MSDDIDAEMDDRGPERVERDRGPERAERRVINMPGRGPLGEPAFQSALRGWRNLAHRRGMVVASPIRLVGGERTFFGNSDDVTFGPKSYRLMNPGGLGWIVEGLSLSDNEKEFIEAFGDVLMDRAEYDIKDQRVPTSQHVPPQEDERGRWDIWAAKNQRIGTVVRVGDGSEKHYLLYLWFGSWYLVKGQPPFDLPMFGYSDIQKTGPIMIHEGPKARQGAVAASDARFATGRLADWMRTYSHVAWHGSDIGMEWTDWSPLRGRRVLIWPDMDEAGLRYARNLARRLARMGNVIEYVNWSKMDIYQNESWDWGDGLSGDLDGLTRAEVRRRIMRIESPIDESGRILEPWAERSFLDLAKKEIYQISTGYMPEPVDAVGSAWGIKNFLGKVAASSINAFTGIDFLPGVPFGRLEDGRINLCREALREPMGGAPLPKKVYKALRNGWLKKMVPDVRERKHLLRRAAWAIGRPEEVPAHMVILQGDSGIGKSVFLDTLVRVAGADRAASVLPETIFSKFNGALMGKAVVAVHEIHSNDLNRRQNASRLKDLIGNQFIEFEQKNRPRISAKNVIHWFAATNETVPFAMEHGNDRFYFVRCAAPKNDKAKQKRKEFFARWVPRLMDPVFCDELYAAAKWLSYSIERAGRGAEMTGRVERQDIWGDIEDMSRRPWEQYLKRTMEELMEYGREIEKRTKQPPVFVAKHVVNMVVERYRGVGVEEVWDTLNRWGYGALHQGTERVRRRMGNGRREVIWCLRHHEMKLNRWRLRTRTQRWDSLIVASEETGQSP